MQSPVFGSFGRQTDEARILLDEINARKRPKGSCRDQLLHPELVDLLPLLPEMVTGQKKDSSETPDTAVCVPTIAFVLCVLCILRTN